MYSFYLEKLVIGSASKCNTNNNKTSSDLTEAVQQPEKQGSLSKIVEEFTAKWHLLCPSGGQT